VLTRGLPVLDQEGGRRLKAGEPHKQKYGGGRQVALEVQGLGLGTLACCVQNWLWDEHKGNPKQRRQHDEVVENTCGGSGAGG